MSAGARWPVIALAVTAALILAAVPATLASSPPDAPTRTISGGVVDGDGRPVDGATIFATQLSQTEYGQGFDPAPGSEDAQDRPESPVFAGTSSDISGSFSVSIARPGPYAVRVSHPEFADHVIAEFDGSEELVVRLDRGQIVEGRVLDEMHASPIPDATVVLKPLATSALSKGMDRSAIVREETTDDGGRFRFDRVGLDLYSVEVTAPGKARLTRELAVTAGEAPRPLDLYLAPGLSIRGRVLDADGNPLPGARVRFGAQTGGVAELRAAMSVRTIVEKTDAEGRFDSVGLPELAGYTVLISHDGHVPAAVNRKQEPGEVSIDVGDVALSRGATVAGRLMSDGAPVHADRVLIELRGGPPGIASAARRRHTDAVGPEAGRFEIDRLPAGEFRLVIDARGFAPLEIEAVALTEGGATALGDLEVTPGAVIEGRLVDDAGAPVAGASVTARQMSPRGYRGAAYESAQSDVEGRFRISGLNEDASHRVGVVAAGYARTTVKDVDPGELDADITVKRLGRVRGRVVAVDADLPVPAFSVVATPAELSGGPMAFPRMTMKNGESRVRDASGRFVLDLEPGSYVFKIKSEGFVDEIVESVEVRPREESDLGSIPLHRGAVVSVRVIDKLTGEPLPNAEIVLERDAMQAIQAAVAAANSTETNQLVTGRDGRRDVGGVAPGATTVRARRDGYAPGTAEVEIDEYLTDVEVEIALGAGGSISGLALTQAGNPAAGAQVFAAKGLAGISLDNVQTVGRDGRFEFEHLDPGDYVVAMIVPSAGAAMSTQNVSVREGEVTAVSFGSKSAGIAVSGRVKNAENPLQLVWQPKSASQDPTQIFGSLVMVTTDAEGSFETRLKKPGQYTVQVIALAEATATGPVLKSVVTVEIPDEPTASVEIELGAGGVAGLVTALDGSPVEGALVTALVVDEDGELLEPAEVAGTAHSRSDGSFEIDGMQPGFARLVVRKKGFVSSSLPQIEIGDELSSGFDVELEEGVPHSIRVLGRAGASVEGAFVLPLDPISIATMGAELLSSGADGQVALDWLQSGAHQLGIVAAGYAPAVADVLVDRQDSITEVRLGPGGRLRVKVVDGDGQPVPGAVVRPRQGDVDLGHLVAFSLLMQSKPVVTDSNGYLDVGRLEAGRYRIEAALGEQTAEEPVSINEDETSEIVISM